MHKEAIGSDEMPIRNTTTTTTNFLVYVSEDGLYLAILEYEEYARQPSKTSKIGHFSILQSKSSDCCLMHQSFATTSPRGPGIAGLKYRDFTFQVSR